MKRILAATLVLGLIAGALAAPATAKKKKKKKVKKIERTVTGSYDAPALVIAGTCAQTGAVGCVSFGTALEESWITELTVTDQHGQPVFVSIQQDTDANNQDDVVVANVCGQLTEPVQFQPGDVHVWVVTPPTDPTCAPGQGTSGSVEITFSNMP